MSALTTTFRAGTRVPAWVLRLSHPHRVTVRWRVPVRVVRSRNGHVVVHPLDPDAEPLGGTVRLHGNPRTRRYPLPWVVFRGGPTLWGWGERARLRFLAT